VPLQKTFLSTAPMVSFSIPQPPTPLDDLLTAHKRRLRVNLCSYCKQRVDLKRMWKSASLPEEGAAGPAFDQLYIDDPDADNNRSC